MCRTDSLQVLEHLLRRHHVAVLGVYVVEVGLVGVRIAVADGLARDYRPVAVLEGVDGGRADAARGRGAGDDEGVYPGGGEQARKTGPVESGGEELVEDGLGLARGYARVYLAPPAPRF